MEKWQMTDEILLSRIEELMNEVSDTRHVVADAVIEEEEECKKNKVEYVLS